jgi:DMSO/TMAO reductase YedYZ molybdopterin-dependent catalytic subunit
MASRTINEKRLSPGQIETAKFPLVGEKEPSADIRNWRLRVCGLVELELSFSLSEFRNLPTVEKIWDTICVTKWTHFDHRWSGVMLDTLLKKAKPLPKARFVRFIAYSNKKEPHDTSLPLDYARAHVLLADQVDGAALPPKHGGPVRTVCEGRYFYKSVKWINQVELMAEDKLGYWERESAYDNNADPWLEQRMVPRPIDADEFARRVDASDFSNAKAVRDSQFAKLKHMDLTGWKFQGAEIKACDLKHFILRGAHCRGANFTLTDFFGADLSGADLSHGDCEGADFRGANLSHADLRYTSLTMTQFAHRKTNIQGAKFRLEDINNDGLGDDERPFLLDVKNGARVEELAKEKDALDNRE